MSEFSRAAISAVKLRICYLLVEAAGRVVQALFSDYGTSHEAVMGTGYGPPRRSRPFAVGTAQNRLLGGT